MGSCISPGTSKRELFDEGLSRSLSFFKKNPAITPLAQVYRSREPMQTRIIELGFPRVRLGSTWMGGWWAKEDSSMVFVDVDKCKEPGVRIRYPGCPGDDSPYGVLCHEVGHHVDFYACEETYVSETEPWMAVVRSEPPVTTYETSFRGWQRYSEAFADAFSLFLMNPELLRVGRPARWSFLTGDCHLKPVYAVPWRRVLAKAPASSVTEVERWIALKGKDPKSKVSF